MSKPAAAVASQMVRLVVPAGKATAGPPVGPALGARGVKSIDFVKEFNARTANLVPGTPTPVVITISPDRTFTFVTRTPPVTHLIKTLSGLSLGSGLAGQAGKEVGSISVKHVYEIARVKQRDMQGVELESVARSVVGSCKSMGVKVVP
ncbi:ribosomal protein L11 [Meredithblackwellia eburnea MCA 4105]